ncbi:MAG: right-handed parallel beta-helix repeat-containing protein [Candidatus Methylacidiphilales bacterium]|nr:right-handed parallel beta-helix repeat-containing protein [Candidatus Methylacidiphilales bacterium]
MIPRHFPLALIFLPALALASNPVEFFVAPEGGKDGDGTRQRPFTRLETARDAARAANQAGKGPVTVHFLGGTYRLRETLHLDAGDSGRGGAPTVYRAAKGVLPVLSGGEVVTGWRVTEASAGLYEATVGPALFRQVYLDGKLLTRARHPNGGWHGPFWRMTGADIKGRRLHIQRDLWDEVKALAGKSVLEVVWNGHWTHYRGKVGAVEKADGHTAIGIDSPDEASFFVKPLDYFKNVPFYFEGAATFVDEVGEWHHDPASGILRVRFGSGVDPSSHVVEVPRLDVLLTVEGTPDQPVRHLEIQGLGFETSNWTRPSTRSFPSTQLAQPYGGPRDYEGRDYPTGMIRVRHADGFAVRKCRIRNAGATGIQFWQNVSNSDIEGNEIGPVMANGIEIDPESRPLRFMEAEGPGDHERLIRERCTNNAIWNNRIRECGRQYVNGGAILAHFVSKLLVDHNEISDLPYTAIQIGNQPGGYKDWGCHENRVRGNRIQRVMQLLDDGGAIYTLGGQQHGTVIEENYISDLVRNPWTGNVWLAGIYLDNFTQFVTVRRNVIVNAPTFYASINGAKDNTFIENEGLTIQDQQKDGLRPGTQRVIGFRPMKEIEAVKDQSGPRPGYDPRAPRSGDSGKKSIL